MIKGIQLKSRKDGRTNITFLRDVKEHEFMKIYFTTYENGIEKYSKVEPLCIPRRVT